MKALKNPRSALCKTAIMGSADLFKAYPNEIINMLEQLVSDRFFLQNYLSVETWQTNSFDLCRNMSDQLKNIANESLFLYYPLHLYEDSGYSFFSCIYITVSWDLCEQCGCSFFSFSWRHHRIRSLFVRKLKGH